MRGEFKVEEAAVPNAVSHKSLSVVQQDVHTAPVVSVIYGYDNTDTPCCQIYAALQTLTILRSRLHTKLLT